MNDVVSSSCSFQFSGAQLTDSLDGAENSRTSAIPSLMASMALWNVRHQRSNSSFCLSYKGEGGGEAQVTLCISHIKHENWARLAT